MAARIRGVGTIAFCILFGILGLFAGGPVYWRLGLGRSSPLALWSGVVLIVVGPFAGQLAARGRPRWVVMAAWVLVAVTAVAVVAGWATAALDDSLFLK